MSTFRSPDLKTLWVWPTGLYPRRVVYYLKAKRLPISHLHSAQNPDGDLQLIPIVLDKKTFTFSPSLPELEDRPKGALMPVVRVGERLIRQSSALLEYLEDFYPAAEGYVDVTGGDYGIELRAHVRAIVQLLNEAMVWLGVDVRHTNESSLMWSGMTKEEQSTSAGEDGRKQLNAMLSKLEEWVREDIVEKGTLSLAGAENHPTLADFTLAATVTYIWEIHERDLLDGFETLKLWFDRYSASHWFVTLEEIKSIERNGFQELFKQ